MAGRVAGPELLAGLREHRAEMIDLLERLARAESPSLDPRSQREPFSILAGELSELGFAVERIPGREVGDHLLATPPQGSPADGYQLILGHMDTVWPVGTLKEMPVRLVDGRLHGPGVYDMKAGLVQAIWALRALREAGTEPALPAVILINTDEELGSVESAEHVRRLAAAATCAFVVEPSFGPAGKLKTGRKGVGRFELRIRGVASHAGIEPEKGRSAILELSNQVQRLFALNDSERGITVNVGTIDGGQRSNVVAPEARAAIEARAARAADASEVEEAILALEPVLDGVEIEVEGAFTRPPLEPTPANRELWRAARDAARELGLPLEDTLVGGASDGNTASLYTATLDGLGAVGDGAHAAHEHVVVDRMPERSALLAMLLARPEGGGGPP
jgi:glutamate carboxypeptidase